VNDASVVRDDARGILSRLRSLGYETYVYGDVDACARVILTSPVNQSATESVSGKLFVCEKGIGSASEYVIVNELLLGTVIVWNLDLGW